MTEKKEGVAPALEPEKLDVRSHDIAEDRRQELLRLFPEVRTKGDPPYNHGQRLHLPGQLQREPADVPGA